MPTEISRQYKQLVNMPQMALTGLSESWLMKEIGNLHWQMLCDDLGLPSNEIVDEFGNRLYATFVRVIIESNSGLKDFKENDSLDISATIEQTNSMLYCSSVNLDCGDKSIQCRLATSFTSRNSESDNTKLTKGVPKRNGDDKPNTISAMPNHILEIIKYKKAKIESIALANHSFKVTENSHFQQSYNINPYTDINGVGLLYYAAYPLISDVCEIEYFNNLWPEMHWALRSATMSRDIIYLGNCNISDAIQYDLNSYELFDENTIALQSTLRRRSDKAPIAKIFTIKRLTEAPVFRAGAENTSAQFSRR